MSTPFGTNNPGIGGLDELTAAEEAAVVIMAGLGTANQVLTTNAGVTAVEWGNAGAGDMVAATYDTGSVAGDAFTMTNMNGGNWKVVYTNGSGDIIELAIGTSGQVLASNGATSAPSWTAAGVGDFLANGTVAMTGDINLDGSNLDNAGVLFIKEQAAADADVAGSGQLWVKTATPNQLWFTDDAGTDTQLGSTSFADDVFTINDDGDATKKIAFQASSITTGTTRTITMADSNVDLDDVLKKDTTRTIPNTQSLYQYDLGSGWTDWYGSGTTSHDTTDYIEGIGSLKIITDGAGANSGMRLNITDVDMSGATFTAWVKSSDWAKVSTAEILISTSGAFTAYYIYDAVISLVSPVDDEWIEVSFGPGDLTVGSGSPDLSTANDLIIRATSDASGTPTVWFDGFSVIPTRASTGGIVSITFDDARDTQYTEGREYMDKYGYKSTYYIIPDDIGTANNLTQAEVDSLKQAGNEIAMHGGTDLTTYTLANLKVELDTIKKYQVENGYSDNFSYPNGAFNDQVREEVSKRFGSGRNIIWNENNADNIIPYYINAYSPVDTTATSILTGAIDDAVNNNSWVVINFHNILTTAAATTDYSIANFQTVIDYLNSSGVTVMPIEQVLAGNKNSQEVIATGAEIDTGTNNTKMVTPKAVADSGVLSNLSEDATPTLGGTLAGGGYDQTGMGTISMLEQAASESEVAGSLQLWAKTATPNQLWYKDDAGTDFRVASLGGTETLINKSLEVTTMVDDLNFAGNNADGVGSVYMDEKANAYADVAGDGQLWVKTATPNQLWFTDDAGTDTRIDISTFELDMGANSIGFTMQTATGDGTTTVDWGLGNHMDFTFGAQNDTFTFTAPANPGVYTMSLKQDSTGSRTATWPAAVKWPAGTAPTLTTTATTGYDVISFRYDGTNYYGVSTLNFS